jgi:hypothetical protein
VVVWENKKMKTQAQRIMDLLQKTGATDLDYIEEYLTLRVEEQRLAKSRRKTRLESL